MTALFTISMMPCVFAIPLVFDVTLASGRSFDFLANICDGLIIASIIHPLMICRYVYSNQKKHDIERSTEL
jgi:hypothetical protein